MRHNGASARLFVACTMLVGCFIFMFTGPPGCADKQAEDTKATARDAILSLQASGEAARQRAESLALGDPERIALQTKIDTLNAQIKTLQDGIAAVNTAAQPTPTEQKVADTTSTLGGVLPPPFNAPAVLVPALLLALLRSNRLKAAATSLADSIEKVRAANPAVSSAFKDPATQATLRTTQTPTAQTLVDVVQGKVDGWLGLLHKWLPV